MGKKEMIERIVSILEKVQDENIIKDMWCLINGVYKHYVNGKWER